MPQSWADVASATARGGKQPDRGRVGRVFGGGPTPVQASVQAAVLALPANSWAARAKAAAAVNLTGRSRGATINLAGRSRGAASRSVAPRGAAPSITVGSRGPLLIKGGIDPPGGRDTIPSTRGSDARGRPSATRGLASGAHSSSGRGSAAWAPIRKLPTNDKDRRIMSVSQSVVNLESRIETADPRLLDSLVEGYIATHYPLSPCNVDDIFIKVREKGLMVIELLYDVYFPVPAFKFISKLQDMDAIAEAIVQMVSEELENMDEFRSDTSTGRAHDPSIVNIDHDDGYHSPTSDDARSDVDSQPSLSYEQWMYPSAILKHPHRVIWRSLEMNSRLAMTVHEMFGDSEQHHRILDQFPARMRCTATCSLTGATVYLGSDSADALEKAVSWLDRVFDPYTTIPASTIHLIHLPGGDKVTIQLRYATELKLFSTTFIEEEPAHAKEVYDGFRQQGVLLSAMQGGQLIPRRSSEMSDLRISEADKLKPFSPFAKYSFKTRMRSPPGLPPKRQISTNGLATTTSPPGGLPQEVPSQPKDKCSRTSPKGTNKEVTIPNGNKTGILALSPSTSSYSNYASREVPLHEVLVEVGITSRAPRDHIQSPASKRRTFAHIDVKSTDETRLTPPNYCLLDSDSPMDLQVPALIPSPGTKGLREDSMLEAQSMSQFDDVLNNFDYPVLAPGSGHHEHLQQQKHETPTVSMFPNSVSGPALEGEYPDLMSLTQASSRHGHRDHTQNTISPAWRSVSLMDSDVGFEVGYRSEIDIPTAVPSQNPGMDSNNMPQFDEQRPKNERDEADEADEACVDLMNELDQAWPTSVIDAVGKGVRNRKEFDQTMQQIMKNMVERLRKTRGDVRLQISLGRIVLWNVELGAIARTDQYSTNRNTAWPVQDALMILNTAQKNFSEATACPPFDSSFHNMVSVRGSDAEWLVTRSLQGNQTQPRAWKLCEEETRVWYEFTCRVHDEKPWIEYVVAVDAQTFEVSCREAKTETARAYIHCTLRTWDLKICATRSSIARAEKAVGEFARHLGDTLTVRTADQVLELSAEMLGRQVTTVTQINVRHVARYLDQWKESTYLDVTMVQRMTREMEYCNQTHMVEMIRGRLQPAGVTAAGLPMLWFEISLSSVHVEAALAENVRGGAPSWTADQLEEQGTFADLANRAVWLVNRADDIGKSNDNQQLKGAKEVFW